MLGLQRCRHQTGHGLAYYADFTGRLRNSFECLKEVVEKLLTVDAWLLAKRACKSGQCKPDLHIKAVQGWSGVVGHLLSLFKPPPADTHGGVHGLQDQSVGVTHRHPGAKPG